MQDNGSESGAARPTAGERVEQMAASAQDFISEAQGAVRDLSEALDLRGRVERHPYGMVLAAAGVGYVLGGGLFTPTTARILRLGMKLAAIPLVRDELLNIAESAVDGLVKTAASDSPGVAAGE